ncbi:peptidoglycan D,D-transpeptidase FtsI family protein [Paraclostridium sordellii]|uniref:peptidoglycan D,D-transpeptidase FtsI family protein n=1 Tax=Paraclostridium sordellii TaxID=1505 RepID=UPI0005DFA275|nr:penicillin-binding protein 2 [Paeniclostridium sordellii]CEO12756.1 peptidoglycan glycosyltransferase [[Clostridium] sordellii] [Paeniclostridium sordellii]CEP87958.1 peptidoglycan glycosyltransferase [[Clostridium] sordellii] [Paeniclostridium sordellii]CEP97306.1 peptidoglycan glycosyltransferase [[Clostridium] sordellii] [Paeniclostridium sordellii]CEQ00994.1 peptidoglycan glycosyltransferase [[Clostridium] sordellii] [Paeniclostridium sordellii]
MSRKKGAIDYNIKNRIYFLFILCLLIYGVLIYRLVDIQIINAKFYEKRAKEQSSTVLDLGSGRGTIYDRNNKKLTDNKSKDIIIIQKDQISTKSGYIDLIKEVTELEKYEIYNKSQEEPQSPILELEIKNINDDLRKKLKKENILIEKKTYRYSDENLLTHTIGYLDKDNNAISGIEKSQDKILKNKNLDYVEVFKAGTSGNSGKNKKIGILNGSFKVNENSNEDRHLRLTIDSDIQKKLEKLVDKEENPSAVVISDVKSGEVLAMTSRPNYNQYSVEEFLKASNGELQNRAIRYMYAPGSVFKIVVLYAALENNIIDENYEHTCTGSKEFNGRILNCNKLDGHGKLTLEQAFANSCNTAFLDIALKVGKDKIIKAAEDLHLTKEVGIDIEGEKTGSLNKDIDIVNLCIGQGEMMFTPLQVNQMTQVIANNGTYKPLRIYDSIIDNNKKIIKSFDKYKDEEMLSPYIITKIKNMMKSVAKEGTAKELSDLEKGSGVKTGTTQAIINVENADKTIKKEKISHGWVTGFYPEDNPKYCITIIIEGTKESSKSAVPLYKDICTNILK